DADPLSNYQTIEHELAAYAERLVRLPRVLALSKCDLLPEAQVSESVAAWQERLGPEVPVIATSSATKAGVDTLARELLRRVTPRPARAGGAPAPGRPTIASA